MPLGAVATVGRGGLLSRKQWSLVTTLAAIGLLYLAASLLIVNESIVSNGGNGATSRRGRRASSPSGDGPQVAPLAAPAPTMDELYRQLALQHEHETALERDVASLRNENEHLLLEQAKQASTKSELKAMSTSGIKLQPAQTALPSGSAWCSGDARGSRHCRFENLCFLPGRESFVLAKTAKSILHNVPASRGREALVDLTSLSDHSAFYFDFDEVSASLPAELGANFTVRVVEKPTFILSRFLPPNIMHTMHDDILGLYHLHRQYPDHAQGGDHYLQFADYHGAGEFEHLYRYFTDHQPLYRSDLTQQHPQSGAPQVTCFRNAVVGQSKEANWYQYGFGGPQGPIANKTVSGARVREVADFIAERSGFSASDFAQLPPNSPHFNRTKVEKLLEQYGVTSSGPQAQLVAVFSRLRNRKLENEAELAAALQTRHGMPVVYVRMEELNFLEQVALLRRSALAVGMHGSILVMAMFMPRGAALLELYPYAVPSNNYTPYRTMARLEGMDLAYDAWENTHVQNTRSYPERHYLMGGLMHLPEPERKAVMESSTVPLHTCCTNPYWLYRIFQDTIVAVPEILERTTALLSRGREIAAKPSQVSIAPSPVDSRAVVCKFDAVAATLTLTWLPPWNGGKADRYAVWDHNSFREYFSDTESVTFAADMTKVAQVWIQTVKDDKKGRYTPRIKCVPEGVVDNVQ